MSTNPPTDIRFALQYSASTFYEAESHALCGLAPDHTYLIFPTSWAAGPATYDWLLETIMDAHLFDDREREYLKARIVEEKSRLFYRGAPILRDVDVPEGRIWPN